MIIKYNNLTSQMIEKELLKNDEINSKINVTLRSKLSKSLIDRLQYQKMMGVYFKRKIVDRF